MAPVCQAASAGVLVAIASNNIANPFSPFGNANLLQAAWLTGLVGSTAAPADRAVLLAAIGENPARILGLPERHLRAGAPADLVVLDTTVADEAVAQAPPVAAVVHAGHLVHRSQGPEPAPR
jgi:cytosine deaminase